MLVHRHASRIRGVLSCFDRNRLTGTLPEICHADAFTRELNRRHVRIFDYTKFVTPLVASRLKRLHIGYRLVVNAFVDIDDFARAQQIPDRFKPETLHRSGAGHVSAGRKACVPAPHP